jgi:hypothetical protein
MDPMLADFRQRVGREVIPHDIYEAATVDA